MPKGLTEMVVEMAPTWKSWAGELRRAAAEIDEESLEMLHRGLLTASNSGAPRYERCEDEWLGGVKTPIQAAHLASAKRTLADYLLRTIAFADARWQAGLAQGDQTELTHHLYQIMHWLEPAFGLKIPDQWLVNHARTLQQEDPLPASMQ